MQAIEDKNITIGSHIDLRLKADVLLNISHSF